VIEKLRIRYFTIVDFTIVSSNIVELKTLLCIIIILIFPYPPDMMNNDAQLHYQFNIAISQLRELWITFKEVETHQAIPCSPRFRVSVSEANRTSQLPRFQCIWLLCSVMSSDGVSAMRCDLTQGQIGY